MTKYITQEEGNHLITTARKAIEAHLKGDEMPALDLAGVSPVLKEMGASFVTLTINRMLRGCVGSIEATQPLIKDVQARAVGAAFNDPRFPPLRPEEYPGVEVEVSRLTPPVKLEYSTPEELIDRLRPGIDGVILSYQFRRATFLPQVWDQLPDPELFLGRLCLKMGLASSTWQTDQMGVETYQVEKFSEGD